MKGNKTPLAILLPAISMVAMSGCNKAPIGDASAQESSYTMLRRLWVKEGEAPLIVEVVSDDGRYALALRDDGMGTLDFQDGAFTRLDLADESPVCDVMTMSPDKNRVLYAIFDEAIDDCALWISDFELTSGVGQASNHRRLLGLPAEELGWYWVFGWSERDEILTTIVDWGEPVSLALVSASTGDYRIVTSIDGRDPNAALNTAGDLIAFDVIPGDDPYERDIHLIADETRETALVTGPGNDTVLGWLPGSDDLFFLSDRGGTQAVWRMPMSGEVALGSPTLVRELASPVEPIHLSGDTFYFQSQLDAPTMAAGRLDVATGSMVPVIGPLDVTGGRLSSMAWSPDGELIAHDIQQGARFTIVVRTFAGEPVQDYSVNLRMGRRALEWMPDGQSIVFNAMGDEPADEALLRLDLETGELEELRAFPVTDEYNGGVGAFSIDPGGRTLAFVLADISAGPASAEYSVVLHDLETGEEHVIHRPENGGSLEYSPDGRWLALQVNEGTSQSGRLYLLPADGGADPVPVYEGDTVRIVGWTPDSQWLYFRFRNSNDNQPVKLWRVAAAGGSPESIPGVTAPVRLHPDGETITYWTGSSMIEVWALSELTPP